MTYSSCGIGYCGGRQEYDNQRPQPEDNHREYELTSAPYMNGNRSYAAAGSRINADTGTYKMPKIIL